MTDDANDKFELDPVLAKQIGEAATFLDLHPVPAERRRMWSTWEQAQALGMTRERWEAGTIVVPEIREFE